MFIKVILKMEESYFIASIRILYHSKSLTQLDVQLYNFQDNLIQSVHLLNEKSTTLYIQKPLRNFYFRLINSDMEISQLFSYFWIEGAANEETVHLAQTYENFIIEIQININEKITLEHSDTPTSVQSKIINAHEHLHTIKNRVFQALQTQNFFLHEKRSIKCNFVRKNKHKNLTALLIKNSSNILKKINQNISIRKTFNQLKTAQTNQTQDEITVESYPIIDKMKKNNSFQDPLPSWQDESQSQQPIKETQLQEKKNSVMMQKYQEKSPVMKRNKSRVRKSGLLLRCRKEYQRELEKETMTDLKNQKETLDIIQSYIADNNILKLTQKRSAKKNVFRKKTRMPESQGKRVH